MSDTGNVPPPLPEQPPASPAVPPPPRSGCLTAFMIVFGIILLLPGLCSLIFGFGVLTQPHAPEPVFLVSIALGLIVGGGGVFLIWAAIRGFRA